MPADGFGNEQNEASRGWTAGRLRPHGRVMFEPLLDVRRPFSARMVEQLADGLFRFDVLLCAIHEQHNAALDPVEEELNRICNSIDRLVKRYAD